MARGLTFLFTILVSISSAQGKNTSIKDLAYEYGFQISLEGVVGTRVYPGPPNYENVRGGDEAEHIWLLKLFNPIALKDDGVPTSNNEAEKNIQEIQLVVTSLENETLLENSVGQLVRLRGSLFHALTGHHHLKVLMDVKRIARK